MVAPIGAVVGITYDGGKADVGDALRTPTGRVYLVVSRRVQTRGRHVGRQHLRVMVVDSAPPGANVLPLRWYKRPRRPR